MSAWDLWIFPHHHRVCRGERWRLGRVFFALLCLGIGYVPGAWAVYSWKDAQGVTHYADSPPPAALKPRGLRITGVNGARSKALDSAAADTAKADPGKADAAKTDPSLSKRLAEEDQKRMAAEVAAKAQREQEAAAEKKVACQRAQANLRAIETGQARYILNDKGEREGLDGGVRERALANARNEVAKFCN
jgi:hypothetical protein